MSEEKKQQVIARGGWDGRCGASKRPYVFGGRRSVGICAPPAFRVRTPGGWGRRAPAKPANEVITDSGAESTVITVPDPQPGRSPSASACEPYQELIELGLSRGRNAKAIW